MSDERKTCTKENPYRRELGGRWCHPDAEEVGEQRDGYPGGDLVDMHCPNCGITFEVELPQ